MTGRKFYIMGLDKPTRTKLIQFSAGTPMIKFTKLDLLNKHPGLLCNM